MTVNDLIERLGGNASVANIAGVGSSAVSNWRRLGCLPPRLYLKIADACAREGFEAPRALFRALSDGERVA